MARSILPYYSLALSTYTYPNPSPGSPPARRSMSARPAPCRPRGTRCPAARCTPPTAAQTRYAAPAPTNISALYLQLFRLLTSTQIWVQWLGFDRHHSKQLDQSPRIYKIKVVYQSSKPSMRLSKVTRI